MKINIYWYQREISETLERNNEYMMTLVSEEKTYEIWYKALEGIL